MEDRETVSRYRKASVGPSSNAKTYKDLDALLHSPLRLAIVSLLMNYAEANFTFIRDSTQATDGNLSVQLSRLKDAGYIAVKRRIRDHFSETSCKMTPKGIKAFEEYVKALKQYLRVPR